MTKSDEGHFEERVEEAVASVRMERERTSTDELVLQPAAEAPLELAELPPKPPAEPKGPQPEDNSPAERALRRKRLLIALAAIVVIGAGIFLAYALTEEGSHLLPTEARTKILESGDDLERKARDVTGIEKTYYSFTDDQGVLQIVDELEKVPEKYRKRVKVMR